MTTSPTFLRRVLLLDAATCVVTGLGLTALAKPLSGLFGAPHGLLVSAGLVLFPCAALMLLAARTNPVSDALGWLIVFGNAGWVLASLVVAVAAPLTGLGLAFVLAQAAAVAGLALLEARALRAARSGHDLRALAPSR